MPLIRLIIIYLPFLVSMCSMQNTTRTYILYDRSDDLVKMDSSEGSSSFYFYDPQITSQLQELRKKNSLRGVGICDYVHFNTYAKNDRIVDIDTIKFLSRRELLVEMKRGTDSKVDLNKVWILIKKSDGTYTSSFAYHDPCI